MSLAVHLHGRQVGTLQRGAGNDYTFTYSAELVAEAGTGTIVLSHSLPVREEPFDAISTRVFFDALLPESSRRDELARELKIDSNDGYGLLAAVGRDCAGAVVIVPEETDATPKSGPIEWLNDAELAELVDELPRRPLGIARGNRKLRLSLAGVQRKLVLVRSGSGHFGLPTADTPSTHLIKPQYEHEYPDLAHNEMFCMMVARCVGLPAAETELATLAGRPCLISRRFDRTSDGSENVRLHQEDICQALGVPANLKYQRDLGPGFGPFRELLDEIGRGADVRTLVRAAVLNFILGNSDAHGKNFAILFAEMGRELAPLYDVVSTAVYELEEEMAMSIGDNFDPESVRMSDWLDMSKDCDLSPRAFFELVRQTTGEVHECARSVASLARAQGWHAPVIDEILAVAKRRAALVRSELDEAARPVR